VNVPERIRDAERIIKAGAKARLSDDVNHRLDRICANCGLSWGAHRADRHDGQCPGHEGRMDWDQGPGTRFVDSGEVHDIEAGTPARSCS
jgi:hypothetical protein